MKFQFKYLLWVILTLPGIAFTFQYLSGAALSGELLHPTGEFSARFMIIAMIATPLQLLFQKLNWSMTVPRWLIRYRRAFGVAAFGYALLHTLLYIADVGTWSGMVDEFTKLGIWTGWVAFAIFIPLAMTSNNKSQRLMKSAWKKLQRWVYPAAVLTLLHWIFVHNNFGPALVHFVPLAALEIFRINHVYRQGKKTDQLA